MKKIVLLLSALVLLAVACDKEEPIDNKEPEIPTNPTDTIPSDPSDTTQTEQFTDGLIPNALVDIDGNHYDAVRLGEQVWMASNLHTSHFANGDAIPDGGENFSSTEPYRYSSGNGFLDAYGLLYNWPATMHGEAASNANPSGVQGICPDGWHLPSHAEWIQLTEYLRSRSEYLCGDAFDQNIAKALAADFWWQPSTEECAVGNDLTANNATDFCVLPAGRFCGSYGCQDVGIWTGLWTCTESNYPSENPYPYMREMWYNDGLFNYANNHNRYYGLSVRCLRN